MGMLDSLITIVTSWQFYAILLVITLIAWGTVAKYFRRVNLSKGKVALIAVVGIFLALGGAGMLGLGSTGSLASATTVTQIQTTTAYVVHNTSSSTTVTDSGTDDTKMSVFYVTEGFVNGDATIDTGVFQVFRTGSLDPASCEVKVIKPPRYEISDTTYHLVNEDASTGVMTAYVYTGSSTGSADGDEPKEKNQLSFAEGVATGFVAFNISLDETGIDPLTQYDSKDINTVMCGYPYTFRIVKSDA